MRTQIAFQAKVAINRFTSIQAKATLLFHFVVEGAGRGGFFLMER
jgi:hypothetical protein